MDSKTKLNDAGSGRVGLATYRGIGLAGLCRACRNRHALQADEMMGGRNPMSDSGGWPHPMGACVSAD